MIEEDRREIAELARFPEDSRKIAFVFYILFILGLSGIAGLWPFVSPRVPWAFASFLLCIVCSVLGSAVAGRITHALHMAGKLEGLRWRIVWVTSCFYFLSIIASAFGAVGWFVYRLVRG